MGDGGIEAGEVGADAGEALADTIFQSEADADDVVVHG